MGRAHARVDDHHARRRSQLRRDPAPCTPWTSSGTASTRRTSRPARWCPSQAGARRRTTPVTRSRARRSICRALVLAAVSAIGLPIIGYGISYSLVARRRRCADRADRLLRMGHGASGGGGLGHGRSRDRPRRQARTAAHASTQTTTGLPNTKLAMWMFLASECLFFGAFIRTYVLYRGASTTGPYPARRLRHPVHLGVVVRAAA